MKTKLYSLLAASLWLGGQTVFAQTSVPNIMTYQGRVTVGGQPFTGSGQFKFALINGGTNSSRTATAEAHYPGGVFFDLNITDGGAGYTTPPTVTFAPVNPGGSGGVATATVTGGAVTAITINNYGSYFGAVNLVMSPPPVSLGYATYWSHDDTSAGGAEPTGAVTLSVANGLFEVGLGDTNQANMAALPANVMTNDSVRLRIWFNDGTNGFAQLTPDQPLAAAPYALVAQRVDGASAVALNNSSNTFSGNGAGLTAVNASTVGGLAVSNFWKTGGNANTSAGDFIGTTDNRPLELRVNGQRMVRLGTDNSISLGGATASGYLSTAGGNAAFASGNSSTALGYYTIASGNYSTAFGNTATASGEDSTAFGVGTTASASGSTAFGFDTTAIGLNSTALGNHTTASGANSTALGAYTTASEPASTALGQNTTSSGYFSTAMGYLTTASGSAATAMGQSTIASGGASIAMGYGSQAQGDNSFAAGVNANATHANSFIWSDGSDVFGTVRTNSFNVLAKGGYEFYTGSGVGTRLLPGATAWSTISDRNAKKNFAPLDGKTVLAKLATVPVQRWNYKWEQDTDVPHIGPMAQDFKAAFYPGRDDKGISTLEFDGVEMAAIQGLNQKLEEQKAENADLKQQLAELRKLVQTIIKTK